MAAYSDQYCSEIRCELKDGKIFIFPNPVRFFRANWQKKCVSFLGSGPAGAKP